MPDKPLTWPDLATSLFDKLTGRVKYKLGDDLASYASLKLATIAGRRWCFALCREGLLGHVRVSNAIRVPERELDALLTTTFRAT